MTLRVTTVMIPDVGGIRILLSTQPMREPARERSGRLDAVDRPPATVDILFTYDNVSDAIAQGTASDEELVVDAPAHARQILYAAAAAAGRRYRSLPSRSIQPSEPVDTSVIADALRLPGARAPDQTLRTAALSVGSVAPTR